MKRIDRAQLYAGLAITAVMMGLQLMLVAFCMSLWESSKLAGLGFGLLLAALALWSIPKTIKCVRELHGIVRGQ